MFHALTTAASLMMAASTGPALVDAGARLFQEQCASCHVPGETSTVHGPALNGVVWRKVAAQSDFAYSRPLRSFGGSWSPARLDDYLRNSQATVPGTTMFFAIPQADERRAIIAYLKTTSR